MDELFKQPGNLIQDMVNVANGRRAEQWLKHVLEAPGYFFGIGASNQIGTATQFLKDVYDRKERPESMLEWARGVTTGHAQPPRKRRF